MHVRCDRCWGTHKTCKCHGVLIREIWDERVIGYNSGLRENRPAMVLDSVFGMTLDEIKLLEEFRDEHELQERVTKRLQTNRQVMSIRKSIEALLESLKDE